jgi:tetratricopeptide (TPR) repeat protein
MTSLQLAMVKRSVNAVRLRPAFVFAFAVFITAALDGQESAKVSTEPDPVEQHFQAAQTFQLAGDLPHASEEYRKAISIGLQRLGNLRSSEGKYSEAIELLTKSFQLDPGNSDAGIDLAVAYFYTGDLAKARSLVEPVLGREPSNFRALNLMGKIEFMQANFQAAADRLQAALGLKADFDVAYSLALADLQLKKLPQATVLFDEMKASMKSPPELHILIGRAYRESGFPEQAAGEFQRAIARDPKIARAHSLLGETYLMEGDKKYAEAQQQFETELALNPKDDLSRYYLGVVQFQLHDLTAAEANLQRVVRERPDSPNAFDYLGQVYLQQGRFEPAETALRKAIALSRDPRPEDGNLGQVHAFLAEALQKQGKTGEAGAELAIAEKLRATKSSTPPAQAAISPPDSHSGKPMSELGQMMGQAGRSSVAKPVESGYINSVSKLLAEAYHNLGVIDARDAQYSNAADEFAEAARWNPEIATLDRNWGISAFRAGQFDRAIAPLERQLRRAPGDSVIRQMLGVSYFMTDEFSKSAETFRPILGELPDNPGLLYAAGIALVRSGDSATAGKLFSRMLERGSNVPEVHLVLGEAYSYQSQYPEALQEFGLAARMNPQLSDVHYYTGMVLFKQGKLDEATKEFDAELALNPQSVPAMYQLAYIGLQQHQPEDAIRLLTEVLKEKPSYADAHYQLGKALLEKDDVIGAIQHLETATRMQPKESYGFYQLSIAYRRAGRLPEADQALHTYQELKEKNPRKPSPM